MVTNKTKKKTQPKPKLNKQANKTIIWPPFAELRFIVMEKIHSDEVHLKNKNPFFSYDILLFTFFPIW